MKYIHKPDDAEEKQAWEACINLLRSTAPESSWDSVPGDCKRALFQHLRKLQGNICCYCQRRIGEVETEIEHFIAKAVFPELQFSYLNLFAACKGNVHDDSLTIPSGRSHLVCSKAKDSGTFHYFLHFVINNPQCESYFEYRMRDGYMFVKEDITKSKPGLKEMLEGMILALRLNDPYFCSERKNAMNATPKMVRERMGASTTKQQARKNAISALRGLDYPSARRQMLGK